MASVLIIGRTNSEIPLASIRPWVLVVLTLAVSISAGALLVPHYGIAIPVLLVSAIAGVIIIWKPVLGIYLLVSIIPIQNVVLLDGGEVTWARVIGIFVFGAWVLQRLVGRESWAGILSSRMLKPGLLFVAFGFASLLWAEHFPTAIADVTTTIQLFGMSLLIIGGVDSRKRFDAIITALVAGGLIAATLTASQFFLQGFDRAGDDITSGLNHTAANLVIIVPFAFYLILALKTYFRRYIGILYLIIGPLAVILTFSRISYILLVLVLVAALWMMAQSGRRNFLNILLVVLIAVSILFVTVPWERVTERSSTIVPALQKADPENPKVQTSRVQHWLGAIIIFVDHPLIGAGFGNFGHQFLTAQFSVPSQYAKHVFTRFRSPHSTVLGIMAELGLVGIVLWMWLQALGLQNLRGNWSNHSRSRDRWQIVMIQSMSIAFVAYFIFSLVTVTHNHKLFWVILGLTEVVRRVAQLQHTSFDEVESVK